MKVLQINTVVNSGSTGRIAEEIGLVLLAAGHESYIAYGRGNRPSRSQLVKIGDGKDIYMHGIKTMTLDRHGFGSTQATKYLIKEIEHIVPDVIALHNLHGYYINIEILFAFLSRTNIPVIWTLFDCWSFTGHCTYFEDIGCDRWISGCYKCPKTRSYPASYLVDNSIKNYLDKKRIFNSLQNMQIVVHSNWLKNLVSHSFLKEIPTYVIPSGIDLTTFHPQEDNETIRKKYHIGNRRIILGVANIWSKRKGLSDLLSLNDYLNPETEVLVLVGVNRKQCQTLPKEVIGIERTEDVKELARLYSAAEVFVNPTYADNFPTTNLEALASGTPVITYNTGGSPESLDIDTGIIVETGNIKALWKAVDRILIESKNRYSSNCIIRAQTHYDKDQNYLKYVNLFRQVITNTNYN